MKSMISGLEAFWYKKQRYQVSIRLVLLPMIHPLIMHFEDAEGGFTVVNPDGDYTGPVISAVELDKTEVNAGEQVTISATVEDAGSGVANVTAYYYENQSIALAYDSNLDKWIGTITVPMNVPDGEVIKIHFIEASRLGRKSVSTIPRRCFIPSP